VRYLSKSKEAKTDCNLAEPFEEDWIRMGYFASDDGDECVINAYPAFSSRL
jgi:hypothetical protein